jgi:type II secretory pathway component PulJ
MFNGRFPGGWTLLEAVVAGAIEAVILTAFACGVPH